MTEIQKKNLVVMQRSASEWQKKQTFFQLVVILFFVFF